MKALIIILLFISPVAIQAQQLPKLVSRSVQTVYNEYKQFMDSSLLVTNVKLDPSRSYFVNSRTQKIRSMSKYEGSFAYDELSLCFAVIYKNDTITRLASCRMDTMLTLMALGTPSNPIRHGDVLPPYVQLLKGKIAFDYKKLRSLLKKMKMDASAIELVDQPETGAGSSPGKREYIWLVTVSCPEIKCKKLEISASNGKILAERLP